MSKTTRRTRLAARAGAGERARRALPYRVLFVIILGAVLALLLAAFNLTGPLSPRTVLLLFAGVLLLLAAALELIFRDLRRADR
jgi:NhaP-type Na+/H+ or K+/H+ antiporter